MRVSRRHTAVGAKRVACRLPVLLLSGLVFAGVMPASSVAQTSSIERTAAASPHAQAVAEAAQRFGIPERWIWAVMRVESGGRVRAVSPKGAMGLMQIMPATWAYLRARHGLGADPFDPRDNILAGAAYLREMHDRYGAPGFLAAYNAGPGRYDDYLSAGRALPAETIAYVSALAPLIGSEPLATGIAVATVDPLAWTRSPLFVARSDGSAGAERSQPDRQKNAGRTADPQQPPIAASTQTAGIFVTRASDGGRP
ncbi:lytic transglycosylase domain-containing protein [uncultured Phenylobacterium sp.]|uniref:lytic transglycosylase domain-containing protein n=1 Tax=Sphingobium sp. DEHP117 TaxID=2993436 RepID=UPI0025EA9385|nr:lytic transglycosylase domain-containing protein [uncultured Phenylobacterium sp.]MDQ4420223.1 lytic transglycosylase domain-containing protein [Sphingobium sp. DEHP117]